MPRRKRNYLPGHTYHIYQRGNNRQPCFFEPENYRYYLDLWEDVSEHQGVHVHAYCLMTNHVHFLATPSTSTALSDTLKRVGSRYALAINRRYDRSGSLWEGRHRSSMVHTSKYFLTCMRYIELNPVRAAMVSDPKEYPWSSYAANAWGDSDWITPHDEYLRLGAKPADRRRYYRELLRECISDKELSTIRKAAHYNSPLGDDQFRKMIEQKYGFGLGYMKSGRPCKVQ